MDCVRIFCRPHLDLGGVGADGEGVAPRLVSPGEGRDDVCLRAVRLRQLQQLLRRAWRVRPRARVRAVTGQGRAE